jgi:hypothetical protein
MRGRVVNRVRVSRVMGSGSNFVNSGQGLRNRVGFRPVNEYGPGRVYGMGLNPLTHPVVKWVDPFGSAQSRNPIGPIQL